MIIKSLYRDYFQKSRIFMYPMLEIKRGSSIIPIETYLAWGEDIIPSDRRLVCLYHLRDDMVFRQFEKLHLTGHKLFEDFKELEDNKGIYIFNFDNFSADWGNFLIGRYSLLSIEMKKKIREFFKNVNTNAVYIDSFINPSKYYDLYAELLNVDASILKEVGELCSQPDLNKELLNIPLKQLKTTKLNLYDTTNNDAD